MQLEILDITRLGILLPHRLMALNIRRVFDLDQHVIAIESFDLPRTALVVEYETPFGMSVAF